MDRKRLLGAVEVARRVRGGDVKWGDAAILAEHLLWLSSHFLCNEEQGVRRTETALEAATPQALIAEIHDLRGALIHTSRKAEMLEQLLALWKRDPR